MASCSKHMRPCRTCRASAIDMVPLVETASLAKHFTLGCKARVVGRAVTCHVRIATAGVTLHIPLSVPSARWSSLSGARNGLRPRYPRMGPWKVPREKGLPSASERHPSSSCWTNSSSKFVHNLPSLLLGLLVIYPSPQS